MKSQYKCNCGEEKVVDNIFSQAKGHDYQSIVQMNPTCTENGMITYSCLRCGYEYDEIIQSKGHVYISTQINASCISTGIIEYKCCICGDEYTEKGTSLGSHGFDLIITIPPSCTELGYNHAVCKYCGEDIILNEIPPTGHNFTEIILKEATCLEDGLRKKFCSNCYLEELYSIPSLGHCFSISTNSFDSTVIPTCTRCKISYGSEIDLRKYDIEPIGSFNVYWNEENNEVETWFSKITYSDNATFSYFDGREETDLIQIDSESTYYTGEYLKFVSPKLASYYKSTSSLCYCEIVVNDDNDIAWSGKLVKNSNDVNSLITEGIDCGNKSIWQHFKENKFNIISVKISFGSELIITSCCDLMSLWLMLDEMSEYIYDINTNV